MAVRQLRTAVFFAVLILGFTAQQSQAACGAAPSSATSDLTIRLMKSNKITSVATIGTAAEGDVAYDATNHAIAYCNGTTWISLKAPTIISSSATSKVLGTVYQNTTNASLFESVGVVQISGAFQCFVDTSSNPTQRVYISNVQGSTFAATATFIVPPNYYYQCNNTGTLNFWQETTMAY